MKQKESRIWYDITMALTYPSVLGAVIYFFFDASIQVFILPSMDRLIVWFEPTFTPTITPPFHFFESFGFSNSMGFLIFLFLTLLIVVHHSVDYLYSKYSEGYYSFKHFLGDTLISMLLAIAYITLSNGASADIYHTKIAFVIFWLSFLLTYLIFAWWDTEAYRELRDKEKQQSLFYLGMVRWFEISGIASFTILAIIPLFITRISWFSYTYVVTSIVLLSIFSLWFCFKTNKLEVLTRKIGYDLAKKSTISMNNLTVIKILETSDLSACARIFVEAYQETYSEPWTLGAAHARLLELQKNAPNYCYVLRIDELVTGFIFARPFVWHDGTRVWIEEIVIEKQHRGKGLGKLLIQTLVERCKNENIVGYSLISEKTSAASKIYRKMGFQLSNWRHMEVDSNNILRDNPAVARSS